MSGLEKRHFDQMRRGGVSISRRGACHFVTGIPLVQRCRWPLSTKEQFHFNFQELPSQKWLQFSRGLETNRHRVLNILVTDGHFSRYNSTASSRGLGWGLNLCRSYVMSHATASAVFSHPRNPAWVGPIRIPQNMFFLLLCVAVFTKKRVSPSTSSTFDSVHNH